MNVKTWCVISALVVASWASNASAQEPPKYDVLKKMYDDALGSLKAAQDAKNQLATKNEEAEKKIADLQKQLDTITKDRDELQRQANAFAEKTFNLRSHYAAWQEFLKRYPTLQAKWKLFLEAELLKGPEDAPKLIDPGWPFRVEG